jgi:hypothetical protein
MIVASAANRQETAKEAMGEYLFAVSTIFGRIGD